MIYATNAGNTDAGFLPKIICAEEAQRLIDKYKERTGRLIDDVENIHKPFSLNLTINEKLWIMVDPPRQAVPAELTGHRPLVMSNLPPLDADTRISKEERLAVKYGMGETRLTSYIRTPGAHLPGG